MQAMGMLVGPSKLTKLEGGERVVGFLSTRNYKLDQLSNPMPRNVLWNFSQWLERVLTARAGQPELGPPCDGSGLCLQAHMLNRCMICSLIIKWDKTS